MAERLFPNEHDSIAESPYEVGGPWPADLEWYMNDRAFIQPSIAPEKILAAEGKLQRLYPNKWMDGGDVNLLLDHAKNAGKEISVRELAQGKLRFSLNGVEFPTTFRVGYLAHSDLVREGIIAPPITGPLAQNAPTQMAQNPIDSTANTPTKALPSVFEINPNGTLVPPNEMRPITAEVGEKLLAQTPPIPNEKLALSGPAPVDPAASTSKTLERLIALGKEQVMDADVLMNRKALNSVIQLAANEGIKLTVQPIANAGGALQFTLDGKPMTNGLGVFPYHLTPRANELAKTLAPTTNVAIPAETKTDMNAPAQESAPAMAPSTIRTQIVMSPAIDMRPFIAMGARITTAEPNSDVAKAVERVVLGQANGDGTLSSNELVAALNTLQHAGKLAKLTETLNSAGVSTTKTSDNTPTPANGQHKAPQR